MRRVAFLIFFALCCSGPLAAQRKPAPGPRTKAPRSAEVGQSAIVIDETLSVLRKEPSLFSEPVHRMQRGRRIQILATADADGVKFYKVTAPPASFGWVQADAVFGRFRPGDEERFAKLIRATDGFDQIEMAVRFFEVYPNSKLKPGILLLFGDLLEELAAKLSKDANSRLRRAEMAASAAPMHSYFLNFVMLDRYRKLGIIFLFNSTTRAFHYDGASWKEITAKFGASNEAVEARKRLDTLAQKMDKTTATK